MNTPTRFINRFAPLNKDKIPQSHEQVELRGIVFDVDGTLWYVTEST